MNLLVEGAAETFHPAVSPTEDTGPVGTFVHLSADEPFWRADNFRKWIQAAFVHQRWTRVRIQALIFNGETVFDDRLWPEPPVLEPITIKVREANIPEWKERKDA